MNLRTIGRAPQPAPQQTWTAVSLFSGAGGLDLGLERAGFQTLACVEKDADCAATLKANRPEWRLVGGRSSSGCGDVRDLDGSDVLKTVGLRRGDLDLVAGGPPCQSYSNLGLGLGESDPHNGDLAGHYLRLVEEIFPRSVLFENVEGFNQPKHGEARDRLIRGLESLGFSLAAGVLNAADFGDPQNRRRFVLIGARCGEARLPTPTHAGRHRTVAEALEDVRRWSPDRPDNVVMGIGATVKERMRHIGPGENFKVLPDRLRPPCWRSGKHQGADTFGRLRLDRPSVTVRTSSYNPTKGRYIHPTENRGLSTLEMAVLQSFPEEWRFVCAGRQSLVGIGRMIGNAVPVRLATALGRAVIVSLSEDGALFHPDEQAHAGHAHPQRGASVAQKR
ncbi:MAG: DNA cytosine methyltransferase [Armatimonadetes bacterium]|nr:DNA cytosine methyltransferase [Armatimonadota bacterium]